MNRRHCLGLRHAIVLFAAMLFTMPVTVRAVFAATGDTSLGAALIEAIQNGNVKVAKTLIKHGADVDARDDQGQTALMMAVRRRQSEAVDLLLSNGADTS